MSAADTKLLLEKGEDNTDGDSSGLDSDAKTSGDAFNTSPPDDEGTRRLKPAKELKKIVYAVTLSRSEQDRCSRIQRLKELLEEPDLVNHRYKKDETPLHLLCRRVADIKDDNFQPCIDTAEKMAEVLLKKGADVNLVDSAGNTVLHIAAEVIAPVKTLQDIINKTHDPNQQNWAKQAPIHKLFEPVGTCRRIISKEHIDVFIERGVDIFSAMPDRWQSVILQSPTPVMFAVEIADVLKTCADKNEARRRQFLDMAENVEQMAVDLIEGCSKNEAYSILTDKLMCYALDNGLKKFIATGPVQECLKDAWYGRGEESRGAFLKKREYVTKVSWYLLKMLLLPFFMITKLPSHGCNYDSFSKKFLERKVEPVIAFIANATSYAVFLLCLIANVIFNNELSRCDNLAYGSGCGLDALDWIVSIFVLGVIVQEANQLKKINFGEYIASFTNSMDLTLIFLFIVYYLLAIIGFYSHVDIDVRYQLVRASYHVLGFASLISCIRFLSYLQVHPVLGPIQLSFADITSRVIMFLIILGTFLVGFAVSVTSIYSARVYSPGKPANATAPYQVDNFWISLKTMFWVLFGFTDDTAFKTSSDVEDSAEIVVGTSLFAVWCVVSIIILINMLIALVSDSFQKIQDNADIEWKFARAWIIRDIIEAPLVPLPINVTHCLAQLVSYLCCSSENTDESDGPQQPIIFQRQKSSDPDQLSANKFLKERYKAKLRKTESSGREYPEADTSDRPVTSSYSKLDSEAVQDGNEVDTGSESHVKSARKTRDRDKTLKERGREETLAVPSSISGEIAEACAEQATLKSLIVKMEANIAREFREIGRRLDALERRLDVN